MDPSIPFVVAALLIIGGVAAAAVAFRRRKAGAALLLGLVLIVAPLTMAAPQGAYAADDCETTSQTDQAQQQDTAPAQPGDIPAVPSCTPATAVADVAIEGGLWQWEDGDFYLNITESTDVEALMLTMVAVTAIDNEPTFGGTTLVLFDQEGVELKRLSVAGDDLEMGEATIGVSDSAFDELLIGSGPFGLIGFEYVASYDDGCGGTLETTIAVTGLLPPP